MTADQARQHLAELLQQRERIGQLDLGNFRHEELIRDQAWLTACIKHPSPHETHLFREERKRLFQQLYAHEIQHPHPIP